MTNILDLIDVDHLTTAIDEGYVRRREHPDNPNLVILNYTEKAQYEKVWTPATLQCRGLIIDRVSGNVLARPFDKFFNVGEHVHPDGYYELREMRDAAPVRVVDKLDGSLGILYMAPDGLPAIATRGSFTSDQAQHATALLRERYADFVPNPYLTHLFEIVYPENRIVLDYGDLDDLILLASRNIETGHVYGPDSAMAGGRWYGRRAEVLPPTTFGEALTFGDRTNREGMVVTFEATGLMVKIKQEDYVRLHRLVTGLNERVVWEHLAGHEGNLFGLLDQIPDEFHGWVKKVSDDLFERFEVLQGRAHHAFHHTVADLDHVHGEAMWGRKEFALSAREHYADLAPLMFQLLDGRDISAAIWKTLKPKGQTESLMNRTEDNS